MPDVRAEVEKLLAEMRAHILTVDDARDTVEVSAIARQMAIPEVSETASPSLISSVARATLLGAWIQYDARLHGARVA